MDGKEIVLESSPLGNAVNLDKKANGTLERFIEPCWNPDCDPEEGCCICEHTGRIWVWR